MRIELGIEKILGISPKQQPNGGSRYLELEAHVTSSQIGEMIADIEDDKEREMAVFSVITHYLGTLSDNSDFIEEFNYRFKDN